MLGVVHLLQALVFSGVLASRSSGRLAWNAAVGGVTIFAFGLNAMASMSVIDLAAALFLPLLWDCLRIRLLVLLKRSGESPDTIGLRRAWLGVELGLLALLFASGTRVTREFGWRHSGELRHVQRARAYARAEWLALGAVLKFDVACSFCLLALAGWQMRDSSEQTEKVLFSTFVAASLPVAVASAVAADRQRRQRLLFLLLPLLCIILPAGVVATMAASAQLRDTELLVFGTACFVARAAELLLFPAVAQHFGGERLHRPRLATLAGLVTSSEAGDNLPGELPTGVEEGALPPSVVLTLRLMTRGSRMVVSRVDSATLLQELTTFTQKEARRHKVMRRWRDGKDFSLVQESVESDGTPAMAGAAAARSQRVAVRWARHASETGSAKPRSKRGTDMAVVARSRRVAMRWARRSDGMGCAKPASKNGSTDAAGEVDARGQAEDGAGVDGCKDDADGGVAGRIIRKGKSLLGSVQSLSTLVHNLNQKIEEVPAEASNAASAFLEKLFAIHSEPDWYAGVRFRLLSAKQKRTFVSDLVRHRSVRRGYLQLMDDARTLRWGWKEYQRQDSNPHPVATVCM